MKRLALGVGLWLGVLACVPTPAPPRDVTGKGDQIFVGDAEPVTIPRTYARGLSALSLLNGEFTTYTATLNPDGTFSIPQVQGGPYYLKDNLTYIVTSEPVVDMTQTFLGRPDGRLASAGTKLQFDVGNLSSWTTERDYLVLYSANTPTYDGGFERRATTTNPPQNGATALSGMVTEFSEADNAFLIETAKGDKPFLTQLQRRTIQSGGVTLNYNGLGRALAIPSLAIINRSTTTITGSFQTVPEQTQTFNWATGRFNDIADEVSPDVDGSPTLSIEVFAQPGGSGRGHVGIMADVASLFITSTAFGSQSDTFGLTFGNPYPASWALIGMAIGQYRMSYQAKGGATGALFARVIHKDRLERIKSSQLTPPISPPRNPKINGKDLTARQFDVGTNPTLTWDAPTTGTPNHYQVFVLRAFNDMGMTRFDTTAIIRLRGRKVVIPPDVMKMGESYAIFVQARAMDIELERTPHAAAFPEAIAEVASDLIDP